MDTIIQAFHEGGTWMWAILFIGIWAFGIILERVMYLYFKASIDKEKFLANVQRAILSGDLNSAVNYCNDRSAPMNNIVKAGLISVMNKARDEEVQSAMDVSALKEVPLIERRTPMLALLANMATLLGLLTTIMGLISSFKGMANVDPAEKASLLAAGISEAMNGTAFGLIVAIPTLLIYALSSSKSQRMMDDIHETSVATFNLILQNRDKFPVRS